RPGGKTPSRLLAIAAPDCYDAPMLTTACPRSNSMRRCLVLLGLFASFLSVALAPWADQQTAHWSSWRGPTWQGHTDDQRVPLTWSETENLLWKTKLPGVGNSTPIVWGDRVFLTASSPEGGERHVLCVRASDGKLLWQQTPVKGFAGERTHTW